MGLHHEKIFLETMAQHLLLLLFLTVTLALEVLLPILTKPFVFVPKPLFLLSLVCLVIEHSILIVHSKYFVFLH